MKDQKDMKRLSGLESHGGSGNFEGGVFIDFEKFNTLPEEIRNEIGWAGSHFLEELKEKIVLEWTKHFEKDKRIANIEKMKNLFTDSGFNPIYVKIIDNQYSSDPYYYNDPWLEVTTQKGIIVIGWRKRVINIDWSASDIKANGEKLFESENVTKDKKYIHAWSYEKAIEYLSKLNSFEYIVEIIEDKND